MSNLLNKYKFELSNSLERLVNETQKESVNNDLKFARRYLNVLVHRLEKDLADKVKETEAGLDYDSPNWAYRQAEGLGYRRGIRKALEIIGPIEDLND